MLLTDREMIINVLKDHNLFDGNTAQPIVTEILDLMFYARKDGYYRAYEEVKVQKEYEERMSMSLEEKIKRGLITA
jgi:hypothetical protein